MRLEEDNKQYEGKLKRAVLNGEGGEGESYKQIQVKNRQVQVKYRQVQVKWWIQTDGKSDTGTCKRLLQMNCQLHVADKFITSS